MVSPRSAVHSEETKQEVPPGGPCGSGWLQEGATRKLRVPAEEGPGYLVTGPVLSP